MRTVKTMVVVTLLAVIVLALTLAWLFRSEQGSRWLLQQGLVIVPVTIEAEGISGTLAEGLGVNSLYIELPLAQIRVSDIVISWRPASLLAGIVDIKSAHIAELSIDIVESADTSTTAADRDQRAQPVAATSDDQLFWLQIPLDIHIESGQLQKLRVEQLEFTNLDVVGSIGHGRLDIATAKARLAGIDLHLSGELAGPQPGRLNAEASWKVAQQDIAGTGQFSGDIDKLAFTQVVNLPETVNFNGIIYDLFSDPRLVGKAEWTRVRLPGETLLYSDNGSFTINSDFLSARIDGSSMVQLEEWLPVPLKLQAFADQQGVSIENYAIEIDDGRVNGKGQIDYSDGLQGQLTIDGEGINTSLLVSELPGELGFAATLLIETPDAFAIEVATATARIAERDFNGSGRVQWRSGKLRAVDAVINAGTNSLSADIKLDKQLAGSINTKAPELAMLWPGLQGKLDASLKLGGTLEKPQAQMVAQASAVKYGSQSLQTMNLNAELKGDNQLEARLVATGLAADQQQLGNLEYALTGTLADHRAKLQLNDGVVTVELRASSGWDGKHYTQHFSFGRLQPEGFDSWLLEQEPVLRLSAAGGQVSAHCWRQQQASICIDPTDWDASSLQGSVKASDFALATLQPLLEPGYSIDGTVNASLRLMRDTQGLQGELHWRQSRTTLGYADDINQFQTVLDDVVVDLVSDTNQTRLGASINGQQGLSVTATAGVNGPLLPGSPLQATVEGRLPDIGLLRPLVQRVFDPGELDGELAIDLDAGGTLEEPLFSGGASIANGTLGLPVTGVVLTDINIAAESKGTDKLAVTGALQSGNGKASIVGEIHAAENMELVADIRIQGQNLAIVRVPDLSVDTSPDLKMHMGEGVFDVSGSLQIPKAIAEIRELPRNAVPRSPDVTVHEPDRTLQPQQETIVTGDIEVILGDDVRFNGFGLNSRLDGGLRLTQKRGGNLRTTGTVRVRDGFLTGYGKELRVDRGELTFTGPLDDPLINIQVSRESIYEGRQYTIGLRLSGTARNVITEPFSRPAMSESDVLSFLLLDQPASSDSNATGAALALGLQQLFPDQSGVFGLDEVSFETNDANQAAMVAGKRINEKLYVRYVFGTLGEPGAFRIRYRLGRGFSLEASTGANQSMDLIYLLER